MRPETDTPVEHELKVWPPYFGEIAQGRKTFEVRLSDREFRMLDVLRLREYDPARYQPEADKTLGEGWGKDAAHEAGVRACYTGREIKKRVGYVMFGAVAEFADMEARHAGIEPGYVVMSLIPTVDDSRALREAWELKLAQGRAADGLPPLGAGASPDGNCSR